MQVEYAFPKAEDRPIDAEHWKNVWLGELRKLGVLDGDHTVELFDFKTFCMHFNAFGMEGEPVQEADVALLRDDSNIHPVTPSLLNLNMNIHVPRDVRFVPAVLAGVP